MMNSGSGSSAREIDLDSVDLESFLQELEAESLKNSGGSSSNAWEIDLDSLNVESLFQELEAESLMNSGVEATATSIRNPSQPLIMPTITGGTNLGGGSSNVWQSMMTMSNLTPSSSQIPPMQNEGILSSAVKHLSNISAQSSWTDLPKFHIVNPVQGSQYQPSLQQAFNGKDVQQYTTPSLADQLNMTFNYQTNQNYYQRPSNQLLPCTGPMVNTQMWNLQQPIGSFSRLISGGGWQQRNFNNLNLSAQQKILGPTKRSSVIASGCPVSVFSNTAATRVPSRPKKKAATKKRNVNTKSKGPRGVSPLSSKLVKQRPLPSNVFPIHKKASVSSSQSDVNSALSVHSVARPPIFLTSNSPSQEPEPSKDQALRLTKMIQSASSNALISSASDISSTEKATDHTSCFSRIVSMFNTDRKEQEGED